MRIAEVQLATDGEEGDRVGGMGGNCGISVFMSCPGIGHISGVFPLLGERTSPTLGCSIEILRDIYRVCLSYVKLTA